MSKAQLLEPICVGCKLALLQFYDESIKLRISNNMINFTKNDITENYILRPYFRDSREDMALLFSSIVRFVELYLLEGQVVKRDSEESNESNESNLSDDNGEPDECDDNITTNSIMYKDCKDSLKNLANQFINGLMCLQNLYGNSCAGLTLQYYIVLLRAGISGSYNSKLLPEKSKDVTERNLLNTSKLKGLWKSTDIERMSQLFKDCESTKSENNTELLSGYIKSIETILKTKDEKFMKIVHEMY